MADQPLPRFQFRLRTLMIVVTSLLALFAIALSVVWVLILATGNYCWDAFGFMMVGGGASIVTLLFGIAPNGILYFQQKKRGDRARLILTAALFLVLIAEIVVVLVVPMKGE